MPEKSDGKNEQVGQVEPGPVEPPASSEKAAQEQQTDDERLRKSALYTALYDSYMSTLLEADKSILAISAGGVGLLVTLMTAFELNSIWHIIYYLIALTFFVISIISCIFIFKRNRVALLNTLMKKSDKDSLLTFLDYLSITCCILGIITTISIGVTVGIQKYNKKRDKDTESTQKSIQINTLNGNIIIQAFGNTTTNYGGKKNVRRKSTTRCVSDPCR